MVSGREKKHRKIMSFCRIVSDNIFHTFCSVCVWMHECVDIRRWHKLSVSQPANVRCHAHVAAAVDMRGLRQMYCIQGRNVWTWCRTRGPEFPASHTNKIDRKCNRLSTWSELFANLVSMYHFSSNWNVKKIMIDFFFLANLKTL